jgi:hypothetical protein
MASETKSSVLKWVGGIAAFVVAAVLLFFFTKPGPDKNAIAPTEFNGFVTDGTSRQLIRNASITVTLGQNSAHQQTDTFGRYSIEFASPSAEASIASLEIQAMGYGEYKNTLALRPGSNYAEIVLDALPASQRAESNPPPALADSVAGMTSDTQAPALRQATFGKAHIYLRAMPPDFMKAQTAYAGVQKKK